MRWLLALIVLAGCRSADMPSSSRGRAVPGVQPHAEVPRLRRDVVLTNIAVGSCLDQRRPKPILSAIEATRPDLLALIGDNVYADPVRVAELRRAYARLTSDERWQSLRARVPIVGVWDDHDYGLNDSGKENPIKREAKRELLEFFAEPRESPRWEHDGVYDAFVVGPPGKRVQIVLLDTRWFRDPLVRAVGGGRTYAPHAKSGPTLLGERHWRWLEQTLREPAEIRLLVSSTGARGVVILSGDRHRGEISCAVHPRIAYPLYELTTSSLNKPIVGREANRLRVAGTPLVTVANFGAVHVQWEAEDPHLTLALLDAEGHTQAEQNIAVGPHTVDGRQVDDRKMGSTACLSF